MRELKQLFCRYNPWWEEDFYMLGIHERDKHLDKLKDTLTNKDVILLTGLRRVGKTTLMRLLIKFLIDQKGIDSGRIFYLSMDDYMLVGKPLSELIDEFRKVQRLRYSDEIYVFLDEVTALTDFEVQLKNLYDQGAVKIYASSSSASILRKGQAYITGRKRTIEIPPLDFEEYLRFKGIMIKGADEHLREVYFEDYLKTGGIPEYVLTGDIQYLRELVDDIICKDIAAVHGIRQVGVLKEFFMLLMERAGKSVSINKMARILDISPDTARRYLELFEETFLVSLVSRHGKLNEKLRSPKKLYAADLGIRVLFTGFRDIGSLFENYVHNLIQDRKPEFVLENGIELDFLTQDKTLIEVKYNDELRDKQQTLFDTFKAKTKLTIRSAYDLDLLAPAKTESNSPPTLREEHAHYGSDTTKVNLGRLESGFSVIDKTTRPRNAS